MLSVIIDVLMIRFSNRIIKEKRALNCPHLKEAIKFKAKLNKMIITNGMLFFVSHIPEFVVTWLVIIFQKLLAEFSFTGFSVSELIEIAQTFHFISIQFQFFGKLRYYFEQHFSPKFYKNRFLTTLKDVLAEFN